MADKSQIDKDIEEIVKMLRRLLQKKGAVKKKKPPEQDDEEEETMVVAQVKQAIEESGLELNRSDLNKPETINKLAASVVVATLAKDDPGAQKTMQGLMNPEALNPQQTSQLCVATEYIKAMQKNPDFKPNMALLDKNPADMSKQEKQQLQSDLTTVFKTNNPNMPDKQVNALTDAVTKEMEKPGATSEKLNQKVDDAAAKAAPAASSKAAANAKADFARDLFGGEGMVSVVPNALGIADDYPELSANSPLANLSGSVLDPSSQAATGELAVESERDLGAGIDIEDEIGEEQTDEISLDDISLDSDKEPSLDDDEPQLELDDIKLDDTQKSPDQPSDFTNEAAAEMENNNINTYESPSPSPPSPGGGGGGG
jgi:hypothetical protein